LQRLAEETENFSGADLKALILNAQLESMHDAMSNSVLNQNSDEVRIFRCIKELIDEEVRNFHESPHL